MILLRGGRAASTTTSWDWYTAALPAQAVKNLVVGALPMLPTVSSICFDIQATSATVTTSGENWSQRAVSIDLSIEKLSRIQVSGDRKFRARVTVPEETFDELSVASGRTSSRVHGKTEPTDGIVCLAAQLPSYRPPMKQCQAKQPLNLIVV